MYKMAQAYAQLGDRESAIRLLRRAIELNFYPYSYFVAIVPEPVRREPDDSRGNGLARQHRKHSERNAGACCPPVGDVMTLGRTTYQTAPLNTWAEKRYRCGKPQARPTITFLGAPLAVTAASARQGWRGPTSPTGAGGETGTTRRGAGIPSVIDTVAGFDVPSSLAAV